MPRQAFSMSLVAERLFNLAGTDPRRVNRVVEKRILSGNDARLGSGHFYTRSIRAASAVPLQGIRRMNRHLLVDVESSVGPWRYVEHSRNLCSLSIRGEMPATVTHGIPGRHLQSVIGSHPALDQCIILSVESEDGWIRLDLDPGWKRYEG